MKVGDYPSLFADSDSSAVKARRKHFLLLESRLFLLLLAVALSITWAIFNSLFIGISLVVSLVFLMALRIWDQKHYDKLWYESRGIAESVKEETWKFVMKSGSYCLDKTKAMKHFLKKLEGIRNHFQDTSTQLQSDSSGGTQITQRMLDLRKMNLAQRKEFYFKQRIQNQQEWYFGKAEWNKQRESYWDLLRFLLEFFAIIFSLFLITGMFEINSIGLFTTAAGLVLSWNQANKHEELYRTYTNTAQSLSFLTPRMDLIETESELSDIVLEAEQEISKEHSTWRIRRI